MAGQLADQVVFVTGGARGRGRSHAEAVAREGADVVLFDRCADSPRIRYPLATEEDLAWTADLVRGHGREALAIVGDTASQADTAAAAAAAMIDVSAGSAARCTA